MFENVKQVESAIEEFIEKNGECPICLALSAVDADQYCNGSYCGHIERKDPILQVLINEFCQREENK